nr:FmdB family zinc ribbon protein [Labedaea rhizosphaerae]
MPTYQYACKACDHRFEEVQSFTDAALTECPQCGGQLRKLYSSVGVVFKGSGFYRTDSRTGSGKSESSTTSSSDSSTSSSSSKKSTESSSASSSSSSTTSTTSTTSTASAAS